MRHRNSRLSQSTLENLRHASAERIRSANCAGEPNRRSVPAMSSTNAQAVPLPPSSMRGENCESTFQQHRARRGFRFRGARQQPALRRCLPHPGASCPAEMPLLSARRFMAQTNSCGGRPSMTTIGLLCRSGRRRSNACAGNSAACTPWLQCGAYGRSLPDLQIGTSTPPTKTCPWGPWGTWGTTASTRCQPMAVPSALGIAIDGRRS